MECGWSPARSHARTSSGVMWRCTNSRVTYPARPGQEDLVAAIQAAQADGGHLVAEAATGTGKTVSAITASLRTIATDHRRLVYATRTNAQQAQVVKEHAALARENWPQ